MKKVRSILWGLVFIALGVIVALNAFEITSINIFFDGWWTLFIIVPCFIGLFKEHDKTGNIIGILIGTFLLLCFNGILDYNVIYKLFLPVIIIIFGLKLIFSGFRSGKSDKIFKQMKQDGKTLKHGTATFSGTNINYDNEVFDGAELDAIFGGVKCDLRNAIIQNDCVINATAVFGGVEILVPYNINIKMNSSAIFGGVDNKTKRENNNNFPTLYINANCMFGGIEIK